MSREIHVRFCEGGGVRFPSATRLVLLCRRDSAAREALRRIRAIMGRLSLELHSEKTRVVRLNRGEGSFNFLGWTVRKRRSILRNPRAYFVQRWPSPKAMGRIRTRVHELTDARRGPAQKLDELIGVLNPVLRGWGNYFRTGNSHEKFKDVDTHVYERVLDWQRRRGGQRTRFRYDRWPRQRLWDLGLYKLAGTVKYPAQAMSRRPSASCVPEIGTHSLKGGTGTGPR